LFKTRLDFKKSGTLFIVNSIYLTKELKFIWLILN